MNDGLICISVCAETADELSKKAEQAAEIADIVELRFDCLKLEEIDRAWQNPALKKSAITTFRPQEQGGKRKLSLTERQDFWNSGEKTTWGDFEHDLLSESNVLRTKEAICSYHKPDGFPKNIIKIFENLKSRRFDIIKIAVFTKTYAETAALWNLLERSLNDKTELIPIAMGEAGKWTRILGLAHGAPMTYASLNTGDETAPGQISARDLIDVYRVKELDRHTEIYGVVGNPVSNSLSPYLHNSAFKKLNLNAVYIPFFVNSLDDFLKVMVEPKSRQVDLNFKGLSVTLPHKEKIVDFLDHIDETAEKIGAVNTVKIIAGKLHGYNTDAEGFIIPLTKVFGPLMETNVGIIGAGGAARACIYALKKEGANVLVFVRNPQNADQLTGDFGVEVHKLDLIDRHADSIDILVNCTPLGSPGPCENETPVSFDQFKNLQLAYDLVYNQRSTRFLREAKNAGIKSISGLEMFIAQAIGQLKIWTGKDCKADDFRDLLNSRLEN